MTDEWATPLWDVSSAKSQKPLGTGKTKDALKDEEIVLSITVCCQRRKLCKVGYMVASHARSFAIIDLSIILSVCQSVCLSIY